MLEMLISLAIVTQDQIPLRAAPHNAAAQHTMLWQGDNLEIRGVKGDYLQVYDHRHERAGFVRASQVRTYTLQPETAPELKAVVTFLKDTPGAESLGISYAAAYLRTAPSEAIDAEIFDALGGMADRLARRASYLKGNDAQVAAEHLQVAANYGVKTISFQQKGKMELCYDGEALRRVMALPASREQKARAALALTRNECVDPALTPTERFNLDIWRSEILERATDGRLPDVLKNRLRIRKAGVWASLAYQYARQPEVNPLTIIDAGQRSLDAFTLVNKNDVVDGDLFAYNEAAIRVGASRWAAAPQTLAKPVKGRPTIALKNGQPGETCVSIVDEKQDTKKPPFTRCTYGVVWPASLTISPNGKVMTLAVQPLDTWREMWVFRNDESGWQQETLPPDAEGPDLGYVEFAGWVPGGKQLLAAREFKSEGRSKTRFELLSQNTLAVERWADKPGNLSAFYRYQDAQWKGGTVAVR